MKRIRLWGVGVFAALVAMIVLLWWLLAGWLVERAVEEVGTGLVGARVDLDSADVGLFPLSVTLFGLQVTDPDEPMTNAVEVRRIAAGIDVLPLFRRKVLIDELTVDGVQVGTPRKESGAIEGGGYVEGTEKAATDAVTALELPSFEKPDLEAILASEQLESLAIIEDAQRELGEARVAWNQRLESLPNKARFDEYQNRIDALGEKGGVAGGLSAAAEIASLQKEIRQQIAALEEASNALQSDADRFQTLAKRATAAPAADVRRLQEKYGLSPEGLANLSGRLLGPKVQALTARGLEWWARLEPIVSRMGSPGGESPAAAEPVKPLRGRGVDVRFPERNPVPDFLIRHATVGLELDAGTFSGTIDHITPDQPVHGQPLQLVFEADELESGLRAFALRGVIDRVAPTKPMDDLQLRFEGLALESMPLSDSETWGIELVEGVLDVNANAKRTGDDIALDVSAMLGSVDLVTRFSQSGPVPNAIAETLQGVSAFRLDARVRGTRDAYEVNLRSDLDGLLKGAVARLVTKEMRRFEADLRNEVTKRTSGPLAALQGSVTGLGGIEQEVATRTGYGEELLAKSVGTRTKLPGGVKLPF